MKKILIVYIGILINLFCHRIFGQLITQDGITMAYISGGDFVMGSFNEGQQACQPPHRVTLSPYYLQTTEVTQSLWFSVMGTSPRALSPTPTRQLSGEGDDYPMYYVSWEDCQEFLRKLNERTGKCYRLPTEAEWEYACRAGRTGAFGFVGDEEMLAQYAWHAGNAGGKTHPVGQKRPNRLGLYDMHGNVAEWCSDWYGENYYAKSRQKDPQGPITGNSKVCRGGSVETILELIHSAFRYTFVPVVRMSDVGFRLALDVHCQPRQSSIMKRDSRSSNEESFPKYLDNGDGTVTDETNGLMWTQSDSFRQTPCNLTWLEAKAYVASLRVGNHSDWRLPTIIELMRMYDESDQMNSGIMERDEGKMVPTIIHLNPVFSSGGAVWYWSGEIAGPCCGRVFSFDYGTTRIIKRQDAQGAGVRAVRDLKDGRTVSNTPNP